MQSLAIICLGVAAVCLCTAQEQTEEGPYRYNMLSEDRYRELSKTTILSIQNLPFYITEDAVRKLLAPIGGTITSVKIIGSDPKVAAVRFSDMRDAMRVVSSFHDVMYMNRYLKVFLSQGKPQEKDPEPKMDNAWYTTANEIRIENLSIDVDKSLYVRLSSYGKITGVQIGFDKNTGSKYGIFRFSNSQEAASAVTHLNGQDFMGKRMRVFLVGEDP